MFNTIVLIIHILATILLLYEVLYVTMQKPSPIQVFLIFTAVGTIIMLVGYTVEIQATTVELALTGCSFSYLGKPFALIGTTLFLASYCGYKINNKVLVSLFIYAALISFIVFTNNYHYLYYSSVDFDTSKEFSNLVLGHGPLYYLYMAGVIGGLFSDLFFAAKAFKKAETSNERSHAILMFILVLSTAVGYTVFLMNITRGYDTTMIGCIVGAICLFILFTRFKFFNVISIAKDEALKDAHNAFLVLDNNNHIEYSNLAMDKLLDIIFSQDELVELPDGLTSLKKGYFTYSARKKIVQNSGKVLGWVIEIVDITDSYNYSQKLEREVQARTRELQHMQRKVVAGFANIVEARDGSTGKHIKNTSNYVSLVANKLQKDGHYLDILTDDYITHLVDAAPLHDIGKISVPDNVLLKPGRLTPEEFEIIKTHTTFGEDIIEKTMRDVESDEYICIAKDIAYCHHEKWDGSGYPRGLKGDDIPLAARIMAVADVYDALISERCYKPPFTTDEACNIIRESSGTHFDPLVAEAFLSSIKEA